MKKHMDFVTSNMSKIDNVTIALRNGETMLRNILCKDCKDAVRSKRKHLHSGNVPSYNKRTLKMLPPERLQIVKDITNMLIQLERSQPENEGEEFCTHEEYYEQEIMETKQMYQEELDQVKSDMKLMENKYKKEIEDKQTEKKKLTSDMEEMKNRNDHLSRKLKTFEKNESELRSLGDEHKRLKNQLDSCQLENKKLRRDDERKGEELKRYRSTSSGYRTRSTVFDNRDEEIKCLKDGLFSKSEELQGMNTQIENLKFVCKEQLQKFENLKDINDKMQKEISSLKIELVSKNEELQKVYVHVDDLKLERIEKMRDIANLKDNVEISQKENNALNAELCESPYLKHLLNKFVKFCL
ncbi:probable DNA double-strand break repair Rad50 ATPase [Pecten maximus]|uniref:probable DNA double-strand break repair Rad50 ATPase n=1 Tax=Pecten maximus TaxID=6579 RepID=UPI0014581DA1|nr:probable DNA double-strand break repair Rad50 ATPase [Pecten maximus]